MKQKGQGNKHASCDFFFRLGLAMQPKLLCILEFKILPLLLSARITCMWHYSWLPVILIKEMNCHYNETIIDISQYKTHHALSHR